MDIPLVSALSIIDNTPIYIINRLISCFQEQTYPNKELIIVNNAATQLEAAMVDIGAHQNVFLIDLPIKMPRGAAYNHGIAASKGQILAQFEATDWHSPDRLLTQVSALIDGPTASVLSSSLYLSYISGRVARINKVIPASTVYIRPAKIDYPQVAVGSELGFISRLHAGGYQIVTIDRPELYCQIEEVNTIATMLWNDNLSDDDYTKILDISTKICQSMPLACID